MLFLTVFSEIHDHLHGRFVHPSGTVSPIAIANPGSLTDRARARAYHVYTIHGNSIDLEARRYDPSTDRFTAWPDAPGAGRLTPAGDTNSHQE